MARGGPPDAQRLVEIRSASRNSYGTGYLLDRSIILTAAHVLTERGGAAPSGDLVIEAVPFSRRTGHQSDFKRATLLWPRPEQLVDRTRPDLALIRLVDPIEDQPDISAILLGSGVLRSGTTLDVSATGFPYFRYDRERKDTVTHQIIGELNPLSGLSSNPGESRYEIAIKHTQRVELSAEEWAGISGSALFAEDRLIGVVKINVQNRRKLPIDFTASRLSTVEHDREFLAAIGDAATFGAAPSRKRPFPPLPNYVCLLDRDPHETIFRDVVAEIAKSYDGAALVCVLAGPPDHLPSEVPRRFHMRTLPRFHSWESAGFRTLSWPSSVTNAEEELISLRRQFAHALVGPEEEPPSDVPALRDLLADPTRSRLFCSDLRESALAPGNAPAHASLLERWLRLLCELASTPRRPLVHLLIVHKVECNAVRAWLDLAPVPPRVRVCLLPPLESCFPGDLDEWLDVRLREKLSGPDVNWLERLAVTLRGQFDTEFVLRDLRRAIAAYADQFANTN